MTIPTQYSILLTGATGMLGEAILSAWQNRSEIYATASSKLSHPLFKNLSFLPFSFEERDFSPLAAFCSPEIVINCAAATNHTWCELNPYRARAINSLAPLKIATLFPKTYFIHISTDAVFGPDADYPTETTAAIPQSVYGKTKREAELLLLQKHTNLIILRTTLVGLGGRRHSPSFAEWVLGSVKAGYKTSLYDDVIFTPVSIWDFVDLLEWIIFERPYGILHASGPQLISKYDFGVRLAKACGLATSPIVRTQLAAAGINKRINQSLDSSLLTFLRKKSLPSAERCISNIKRYYISLHSEVSIP